VSIESILQDTLIEESVESPSPVATNIPAVQGVSIATGSAFVVSEVIDGDTIRLSTGETVRYIGIDTPETRHPQKGKECFGSEASRFNEDLVLGKTVQLEKDVSETDRYGRLLRYVWLDGILVNQTLVAAGYAQASAYPPDIKYQGLFDVAEAEARENNRGLWGVCNY
jgi:micrococcal nuclease